MVLSGVRERLGDHEGAAEAAERALVQAERGRNTDQQAASHERLALLLIETHPDRAIHHFGRSLELGGREDADAPQAWRDGVIEFEGGRFEAALTAFELVASSDDPRRPAALVNVARCRVALEDVAGAADAFRTAASASADGGNRREALASLKDLVELRRSRGEATNEALAEMRAVFEGMTAPQERRGGGIVFAGAALESNENELAETALLESLAIATSDEWADTDDEISARRLLGTLYRRTARNPEACEQYEKAIHRAMALHDERAEGDLRGRFGIALRQLGRLEDALSEYDRAIEIGSLHVAGEQVATHKMNRASVLFELGRDEDARSSAIEAWHAFEEAGNLAFAARTLLLLRQNTPGGELPPELATRLRELMSEGVVDENVTATIISNHAMRALAAGDIEGERAAMTEVLELIRGRGDRVEEIRALLNRARVMAAHDADSARTDVIDAVAIARSLDNIELEVDAIEVGVDLALAAGALPETIDGLRELDRGWTSLRRRLSRDADRLSLASRASHGIKRCAVAFIEAGEDEAAAATLELARAQALGDLLAARSTEPGVAWVDPIDLGSGRTLLNEVGAATVAVGLDIVEGETVVSSVGPAGPAQVRFPGISAAGLARLLDDYRHEVITYRGRAAQTWFGQAAPLLGCVADQLEGATTVVLLPDAALNELPLHAVPMPDGRRLIEHSRVVYAPSLHTLALLRTRPGVAPTDATSRIATVGVAFPDEARAIALRTGGPCLSGRNLDKELVRDLASDAKVLHFACHG